MKRQPKLELSVLLLNGSFIAFETLNSARYLDQVRKDHNKLFIVKLNIEIVFSKKDFNPIFKFI